MMETIYGNLKSSAQKINKQSLDGQSDISSAIEQTRGFALF